MRTKFLRSEANKRKRLEKVWRRPRGQTNKLRREEKGKGDVPKIGLKKPKKEIAPRIFSVEALKTVKVKEIIIGSGVGIRKKADIVKACEKKNIIVLNKPAKVKVKEKKEEVKKK
jgi:ribosomal protein L32E